MYKSIVITLSVVSIDYRIFIFSNMFGLADQSGVPGPQGADSTPSLLCEGYFPNQIFPRLPGLGECFILEMCKMRRGQGTVIRRVHNASAEKFKSLK